MNADVSPVEQIKRFAVLTREWSPERRKVVPEKYATEVDALYAQH